MKSVTTKSSNPDLVNINFNIERIKRGFYALSGELLLNIDIAEGDSFEVELTTFRSSHGDGDFRILPFELSRRHLYDALNGFYKDVLMDTLKDCSDLPYFEDTVPIPVEKKTYVLNKCKFSQDGMPNHMETGQYKVILSGYGEVEWKVELIVEVEPNFA